MNSEDDISPLLEDEGSSSQQTPLDLDLDTQNLILDPEFDEVVYGYQRSRWRKVLVYTLSCLLAGLPFLVFHWVPRWRLYVTATRCHFSVADVVLIIETYQKKCKSFYIHRIRYKNVAETSGILNEAYQADPGDCKESLDDNQTAIHLDDGTTLSTLEFRYFHHKKCALIWDHSRGRWSRLAGMERGAACAALHRMAARAPGPARRQRMLNIYGTNEIKVPFQSVMTLIALEVFNPFYIFQVFTIGVWLAEEYYYYCIAVVLMSTFGVATSVIQTKKNQTNLRATVESGGAVDLYIGSNPATVESARVAPGDIVRLDSRCRLHFDAVLLSGSVVINESMLTGESVPVTKTPLPVVEALYSSKEHSSHTLFCGTEILQSKPHHGQPVRALVLRTGYNTTKGALVRSILYPTPSDFKFDRDSYKFIVILAGIAAAGLAYTIALKAARAMSAGDIVLKALDIITIVIPPALPAAMTVGRLYAVARLRRARIACLNTRAVNVSGSLDCICFDKTGTLTEDGLDMWGVVPARRGPGAPPLSPPHAPPLAPPHAPPLDPPLRDPRRLNDLDDLKLGMATCHSLTLLDGQLGGDPLDLKMFESTGWRLEEPCASDVETHAPTVVKPARPVNINVDDFHVPLEVGILRQNQFVSSLQRASVAARVRGEDVCRLYCKGAPEMLRTLCRPDTVPHNLTEVQSSYAEKGYRIIALASKVMEVDYQQLQRMTREEMECELEFLGLVVMENRLKAASAPVIQELREANVHVAMVTGDNIHTAVSVARECGILAAGERVVHVSAAAGKIPALYCQNSVQGVPVGSKRPLRFSATSDPIDRTDLSDRGDVTDRESCPDPGYKVVMTGDTWRVVREHGPALAARLAARGAVFARMTADQKQQLIGVYQALGYYVGMCGDGANDCGALRAAHTGISLSELESSVAAPFTSQDPDIVCVSRVLREGRAALTTSFGVFKFMIGYSLTEFFSVAFLYYFDSNLTDFQFLFIDVALIVNFAFFFGHTEAYTGKLCKIPPLTSLLGTVPLMSLVGQMALIMVAQWLSYYAITQFPWYVRHTYTGEEKNKCWENYAIFAVSMFQYIILVLAFSHGAPYRRSVITNRPLMISVMIMTAICVYITVAPAEWLAGFMELQMPLDVLVAYIILVIAAVQLVLALFFERVIVQFLMEEKQIIPRFIKEKRVRKTPHLLIKRQLCDNDYLDYEDSVSFVRELNGNGMPDQSTKGR